MNVHKKNLTFLKLSLTTLLLQLLLHNMQSSIWKLIGQYDYPKLECHQSLNPETLYATLAIGLLEELISTVVSMQFLVLNSK